MKVIIKPFDAIKDTGLIYSTLPKGIFYGCKIPVVKLEWFKEFHSNMPQLLLDSTILIACAEDDEQMIFGYAITSPPTCTWVYVKPRYREAGIANLLLKNQNIKEFKYITKIGAIILEKRKKNGRI